MKRGVAALGVELELRVHGIGDHKALSAQGSGVKLRETREGLAVYEAPKRAAHPVHFLNWSRTSRSRIALLWYLAFPFTLLNMAGAMSPEGRIESIVQRILVWLFGIGLTVGMALWMLITMETVVRHWRGATEHDWLGLWMILAVGLAVGGICLLRPITATSSARVWILRVMHVLPVVVVLYWIERVRPASFTNPPPVFQGSGLEASFNQCWVGGSFLPKWWCVVFERDVVTRYALYSIMVAFAVFAILAIWSAIRTDKTWSGLFTAPWLGTGVAIFGSTLLLHSVWSALRLAADWIITYFDRNFHSLTFLELHPETDRIVKVWDSTPARFYGPDLVSGLLLPILVMGLVTLLVVAVIRVGKRLFQVVRGRFGGDRADEYNSDARSLQSSPARARLIHRLIVASSQKTLTALVLTPVCLWAVVAYLWWDRFSQPISKAETGRIADLSVFSVHLMFVGIVLLLTIRSLRRPLSTIGDIAGFWDNDSHPLAGRSYRTHVIKEIQRELDPTKTTVLVGHSQGSILAFTAARGRGPTGRGGLHLVTCGSPLASLYGRFFPSHFNLAAVGSTTEGVASWGNFWRDTDPIASPLAGPGLEIHDDELSDPPPGLPILRGHGDYWLEDRQNAWIASRD